MKDSGIHLSRRNFCKIASGTVLSFALGSACRRRSWSNLSNDGRLSVRPREAGKSSGQSSIKGQIKLGLDRDRDGILQLPKAETNSPLPLLLFLPCAIERLD